MEEREVRPRRRVEDAERAIREAVAARRLDPDVATRWMLGLSKAAQERRARCPGLRPSRRATDA